MSLRWVNFIGAIVFSVLGFLYVANKDKEGKRKNIAPDLIIRKQTEEEILRDAEIREEVLNNPSRKAVADGKEKRGNFKL